MSDSKAGDLETVFADLVRRTEARRSVDIELLATLAGAVGCEWATYWKVSAEEMRLVPAVVWSAMGVSTGLLERDTQGRKLSLSEGTAGHVWRTRRPIWTTNIVRDMCLPRSLDAAGAGLQGGVWFALKTDDAVYGVIELLGRNLHPASEESLVALEQLGISLGRLIEAAHLNDMNRPPGKR